MKDAIDELLDLLVKANLQEARKIELNIGILLAFWSSWTDASVNIKK